MTRHLFQSFNAYALKPTQAELIEFLEATYQAGVGPHINQLKQLGSNPNLAYGELKPPLLYEIIQLTEMTPNSLFLDLGSGVGNVVTQASLQTGCESFGIEINDMLGTIAEKYLKVFARDCKTLGYTPGEITVERGDMRKSSRLTELLPRADVLFVNNERFSVELNQSVVEMIGALKNGAYIISLQPLGMSVHAATNERHINNSLIPCCITQHPFLPEDVSWAHKEGGSYYLHLVDRKEYDKIKLRAALRSQEVGYYDDHIRETGNTERILRKRK
ncbi:histone methylation protein DOT1-domain-containing protein [Mycena haematopus]|nr:histone methylation protein DOT1-domain-containing protein [Mycena haematopus]